MNFGKYNSLILDCDGVILDSNKIKDDCFLEVASQYGDKKQVKEFMKYSRSRGGVSRFDQMLYFHSIILGEKYNINDVNNLVYKFSKLCMERMVESNETPGFRYFINNVPSRIKKFVVSGTEEKELRTILEKRGISQFFDGIYGSPNTKAKIYLDLLKNEEFSMPFLAIGDSEYDHTCAVKLKGDFVFMYGFTNVIYWNKYCKKNNIMSIQDFGDLLFYD